MTNSHSYLGTEPVGKLLLKLALPTVLAQIINMLYSVVDRIFIGHIPVTGGLALTGIGVCAPIIYFLSAIAALISYGSSARASMSMGGNDYPNAEKIMGNTAALLIIVSIIETVLTLVAARPMLLLFGASSETIEYAVSYVNIYVLGSVFVSLTLGLNTFITAQGFAKISMLTVVIGAICNIILDPVFIYGFGMGVKGAALATVISQAISAVWVVLFLCGKKTVLRLRSVNFAPDLKLMLPCIALGLSPFIMQSTESLLNIAFNSSLLKYGGDTAVGAMTILSTVMHCTFLVLMGLTQGAQPIVSYNFGGKNAQRVKDTFRLLLIVSLIFTVCIWIVVILFPGSIASLLTSNIELRDFAAWAMRIYCAGFIVLGIQTACQQTFIGIGNAKSSIFLAILRKLILLIPLIYILPNFFENKVFAVYLAEPVADVIAVATTATLFFFQFRKAMKKISE
ncbi:MAG: MATE family efflux transporter [Oscillospiraceae bacterium]|nr:MATE family efflux transporter [Oscillospiraceae bacterium]